MDWQIEDIIELFGEALDNYGERTMPFSFLEDFAKAKGFTEEDATRIVEAIKEGAKQPEFTKFPESTTDWTNIGKNSVPDGHVSRAMFNFTGTQRFLTDKFPRGQGGLIDYKNLSVEEQNRLTRNFYDGLNPNTTGSVEFYVVHQGTRKVDPGDVRYGRDVHQIPGFYTDPVGHRELSQIRGQGTSAPLTSYYKVQIDTNNLLIDIEPAKYTGTQGPLVSGRFNPTPLGEQMSKIDWDVFAKETGVSFDDLVEATKDMVNGKFYYVDGVPHTDARTQTFTRMIKRHVQEISGVEDIDAIAASRKAGIEGFVTGPVNVQYEIVFLDPNDDLGYGKRMNMEKVGIREFQANQSKVKKIDSFAVLPFIDETAVDVPDTLTDDIVADVDRQRFEEFMELAEPEGTVIESPSDVAAQQQANIDSQLTPNESDEFADIVDNLNKQADNLPVDKVVKNRFKNRVTRLGARLLTPGGLLDFVDIYETAVLGLAMVIAAAPELKNFANTYAHNFWNNLAASHGVAAYNPQEYEPDWERINNIADVVEKVSPTDMLINKVSEYDSDASYVSTYLPSGVDTENASEKLKDTLSFMRENPVNTKNEPDRMLEAFINGNSK